MEKRLTMWPFKKHKHEPTPESYAVDMDRETISLEDDEDPTSIMFQLAMRGDTVAMGWNEKNGVWEARVGGRDPIEGATQADVLREAGRRYL